MNTRHLIALGLASGLAVTAAIAAPQVVTLAEQKATESSVVNHAEGGSISMRYTASNQCPTDDSAFRRQVFPIRFQRPFTNSNYVATVGLSTLDAEQDRNVRISASVESRTRDGMTIVAYTWCNTIIHGATFHYSAVGN